MNINAQKYSLMAESVSKTQKVIPTMLAVYTLKSDGQLNHLNPEDSLTDSVECISSLTGDCFEIRIILRLAREQRIRLAYFAQSLEMNCGWKTAAFAKEKTSPPCSFLIDHRGGCCMWVLKCFIKAMKLCLILLNTLQSIYPLPLTARIRLQEVFFIRQMGKYC